MQPPSLIVIAVDGLRAQALGAYGNAWYGTPGLDRLASDATVFDQFLLESHDVESFYARARIEELADSLGNQDYRTLLVTDSEAVIGLPLAAPFDRVCQQPQDEVSEAAADPAETATAVTLARMLDQIEQTSDNSPVFVWTHLRFASGPWDAPTELTEELVSEEDPEVPSTVQPPSDTSTHTGDDLAFTASIRYARQVMALDACLGAVVAALDEVLGPSRYTLAIVGVRGFALGEHGCVGIDDPRPYAEMRHAPLLLRSAGDCHHRRVARIVSPTELGRLLLASKPDETGGHQEDGVLLHSPAGHAWQNGEWKLVTHTERTPELYSKPDDRWEINDVAVRHEHVVEELQQALNEAAQKK